MCIPLPPAQYPLPPPHPACHLSLAYIIPEVTYGPGYPPPPHPTPSPPSPTHLLSSVKGKKEKISGYRLKLRWGAAKIKGTVQLN